MDRDCFFNMIILEGVIRGPRLFLTMIVLKGVLFD